MTVMMMMVTDYGGNDNVDYYDGNEDGDDDDM